MVSSLLQASGRLSSSGRAKALMECDSKHWRCRSSVIVQCLLLCANIKDAGFLKKSISTAAR
eukprot:4265208-Alexandrium_andersonii.AAC.1